MSWILFATFFPLLFLSVPISFVLILSTIAYILAMGGDVSWLDGIDDGAEGWRIAFAATYNLIQEQEFKALFFTKHGLFIHITANANHHFIK